MNKEHKELIEQGNIHINVMFEIIGNPKEHVEKAMSGIIKGLKEDKDIHWIKEELGAPEETSDGLWGTFCESEIIVKDLNKISMIALNFAPASIEILNPETINLTDKDLNMFLGDLLSQIHQINSAVINYKSENKALQKNINAILRNAILVTLLEGTKTDEEIGKRLGIPGKTLQPILEAMIKEEKLVKEEEKYKRK